MTILIFFIVLSVLVLAHEYGHYITAKRAGAKVEEFGFGFPPKVFSIKRGDTVFSFNLIPFGGFVRIFGESGEHRNEAGSFTSLKISKRVKIVCAGVFMNIVLAYVLLSFGNLMGRPMILDETNSAKATNIKIQITALAENSPASNNDIKIGDSITGIKLTDNTLKTFSEVSEFRSFVESEAGKEINLVLLRGKESVDVKITPRVNPPENEGALGVALAKTGLVKSPWYLFLWSGLKDLGFMVWMIGSALFLFFKTLLFEGRVMGEITGPIGIASLTGEAYNMGMVYLLNLVAILSVNLAILNIMPFPALDGGRLVFLIVEKIKGSPLSQKFENTVNVAGFILLLALMFFVTWKDIVKFF
ncbi:MAG: site-2 protease family protein [bacterium]|nr:site-2 protease family protein [bacterium]